MVTSSPQKPDDDASALIPHLLTLATQATDQVMELTLTMDTHTSVEEALGPEGAADAVDIPIPTTQLHVMRRALIAQMHAQLKALAKTNDALYVCAAELAAKR